MRHLALLLATALPIIGCVAADDDADPDFDSGKADGGTSATLKGAISWTDAQTVTFDDADGNAVDYIYYQFELSGAADLTFQTEAVVGDTADKSLDTILYLYQPHGNTWGASIAKDDNTGSSKLSKLTKHVTAAGTYRVVVKRKNGNGDTRVNVVSACSGVGCALPQIGCTTQVTRLATPELFIGPKQWEQSIEDAIDSAAGSLDIQMYLFTVTDIAQHVIDAYQRGVAVRVLLDPHEDNSVVQGLLTAAGVPNQTDPTVFTFAHAKYMVIDGTTAVVLSGNFNAGAVDTTDANGERNYGFVDHDQDDAARIETVFEDDWTSTSGVEPDLSCTRMIVSPVNSKDRILAHVNSATRTLDIEVLYLDDTYVRAAVVAAHQRGVAVRIMVSDPTKNPQNTATLAYFKAAGISIKVLLTNYLHTKMIQADGIALVGSENMSETSLTMNREMGADLRARPGRPGARAVRARLGVRGQPVTPVTPHE